LFFYKKKPPVRLIYVCAKCTWERDVDITPRFQGLVDSYLHRQASKTKPTLSVAKVRTKFAPIRVQPAWLGGPDLVLRDYQLAGLNWLAKAWCVRVSRINKPHRNTNTPWRCRCDKHSVILADEMGLGKTIQSVSFLSYLFHTHGVYGPHLVIVPLSTFEAWRREFARWNPDMDVVTYMGDRQSRDLIRELEFYRGRSGQVKFNVLLTTCVFAGVFFCFVLLVDFSFLPAPGTSLFWRTMSTLAPSRGPRC
jgi:chromodomain-helicase-DNA-binding protein 1